MARFLPLVTSKLISTSVSETQKLPGLVGSSTSYATFLEYFEVAREFDVAWHGLLAKCILRRERTLWV